MSYKVLVGGNWNNGGYTGPRCRNFNNSAGTANVNIGSRGQRCIGVRLPLTAEHMTLSFNGKIHDNPEAKAERWFRLFVSKVIENKELFK